MNHATRSEALFCRLYLGSVREDQRQRGAHVPPLACWRSGQWFEVSNRDTGGVVWRGTACCWAQAKAQAILSLLRQQGHEL